MLRPTYQMIRQGLWASPALCPQHLSMTILAKYAPPFQPPVGFSVLLDGAQVHLTIKLGDITYLLVSSRDIITNHTITGYECRLLQVIASARQLVSRFFLSFF